MAKFQIFGAVALRRLPVISPQLDAIELRVQNVFKEYEDAYSKLSAHEELKIKESKDKDDPAMELLIHETAQDREDKWNKKMAAFSFGSQDERLTRVDYLFAKQKFGSDIKDQWLLPQTEYNEKHDKNLLETGKRALQELLHLETGYRIVGKIPSSAYSFAYPQKIRQLTGYFGAKVFFLKAYLDDPSNEELALIDPKNNEKIKWCTSDESQDIVHQKYLKSLLNGMHHENRVDVNKVLRRAELMLKN